MFQLTQFSRGVFAFAGQWRRNWRHRRQERRVRLEHLSRHLLRDLGLSSRDAQDLTAQERARFLS